MIEGETLTIAMALFFLVDGFLGLLYLVFSCIRDYRIDVFRHRLFNLRFSLFCCMRENQWSFDNPHYRELESHINAMILFAPQLSFARVILTMLFSLLWPGYVPEAKFEDELTTDRSVPPKLTSELHRVHQKLIVLAGQHIYKTYPLTWPFVAGHFAWFFIKRLSDCGWSVKSALRFIKEDFQAPSAVRLGVSGTLFLDPRVIIKTMKQLEQQAMDSERAFNEAIVA